MQFFGDFSKLRLPEGCCIRLAVLPPRFSYWRHLVVVFPPDLTPSIAPFREGDFGDLLRLDPAMSPLSASGFRTVVWGWLETGRPISFAYSDLGDALETHASLSGRLLA